MNDAAARIAAHAATVEHLAGLVVFSLAGDVVALHARDDDARVTDAVAPLRRLLVEALACRAVLEPGANDARLDVLVETSAHVIVVVPSGGVGVAFVFDAEAPLGLARGLAHATAKRLVPELEMPASVAPLDEDTSIPETPRSAPVALGEAPSPHGAADEDAPAADLEGDVKEPGPVPVIVPSVEDVGAPTVQSRPPTAAVDMPAELAENVTEARPPVGRVEPKAMSNASGEWPVAVVPSAPVPPSEVALSARRAVSFATANAADPHVILVRLALRTGLGLDALMHLERLGTQGLALLETAVEDMFGIDRGRLREMRAASVGTEGA